MKVRYIGGGQFVVSSVVDGVLSETNAGADYSFPSIATDIGWSTRRVQRRGNKTVVLARRAKNGCEHPHTDGSVGCPDCGVQRSEFIAAATDYLYKRCS